MQYFLKLPVCSISCNNINRQVKYFGNFYNSINMSSRRRSHVMSGAGFAPPVYKFPCAAAETRAHIRIAEFENFPFFVDTLGDDKLEIAVLILCYTKVGNIAEFGVELREVTAADFAVKYSYDFHRRLFL